MRLALEIASSGSPNDLPIAAVIVDGDGSVIGSSKNCVVANGQVTAHAELLTLESVGFAMLKKKGQHMTIVVTLEPCPMCGWAIRNSGIGRLIFGAYNPQYGAAGSVYDLLRDRLHGRTVEVVGGVLEEECQQLLGDAFSHLRNNKRW